MFLKTLIVPREGKNKTKKKKAKMMALQEFQYLKANASLNVK